MSEEFVAGKSWRIELREPFQLIPTNPVLPNDFNKDLVLDEVVIDKWFHLEQMDDDAWWIRIGDLIVDVNVNNDGTAKVTSRIELARVHREGEDSSDSSSPKYLERRVAAGPGDALDQFWHCAHCDASEDERGYRPAGEVSRG